MAQLLLVQKRNLSDMKKAPFFTVDQVTKRWMGTCFLENMLENICETCFLLNRIAGETFSLKLPGYQSPWKIMGRLFFREGVWWGEGCMKWIALPHLFAVWIQVISHDMKGNMICVGIEFCGLHSYIAYLLRMFCHIYTMMQNVWCFLTYRKWRLKNSKGLI